MSTMTMPDLRVRWQGLKASEPKLRVRDAANRLGVSELELVALGAGETAVRLEGPWHRLVAALPDLGPVMALTRNNDVVHEKTGTYAGVEASPNGAMGLVLGEAIDLRLFFNRWRYAFAVTDHYASGLRSSLQFFHADGTATHKLFLTDASDRDAFDRLVERFRAPAEAPPITVEPAAAASVDAPDGTIDVVGFRAAWDALDDTHAFFGLLKKFRVGRVQGLRLAGPKRAVRLANDAPRRVLTGAAATALPIMVFVGNPGTLQIHTGPVADIRPMGPWINVLDPGFNLHFRETGVDQAWLVRKPTADGVVTSVEAFDADGVLLATFFGKRKPGLPEDPAWRAMVEGLA